jgi:hypothetical protein
LYKDAVSDAGNGFGAYSMTRAKREILGMSDDEIKQDLLQLGWKPIEDESYREQQITIQYRIDNKPTNE